MHSIDSQYSPTPAWCDDWSVRATPRWLTERFATVVCLFCSALYVDHAGSLSRQKRYELWHGRHFHRRPYLMASETEKMFLQSPHLTWTASRTFHTHMTDLSDLVWRFTFNHWWMQIGNATRRTASPSASVVDGSVGGGSLISAINYTRGTRTQTWICKYLLCQKVTFWFLTVQESPTHLQARGKVHPVHPSWTNQTSPSIFFY